MQQLPETLRIMKTSTYTDIFMIHMHGCTKSSDKIVGRYKQLDSLGKLYISTVPNGQFPIMANYDHLLY